MMQEEHQIVLMRAGVTSGSGSPMWRCNTLGGERVNVFRHADPSRDTFKLFEEAGYGPELLAMQPDEELTWNKTPIRVLMAKSGQWWNIVRVLPRQPDAQPDPKLVWDTSLFRISAVLWADNLLNAYAVPVVFLDTETTGVGKDDEIISIAVLNMYGEELVNLRVAPDDLERVNQTTTIHGLTAEDFSTAPSFKSIYRILQTALDGNLWCIYNEAFDTRLLDQTCARYGLPPLRPAGVNCIMKMFAEFNSEWDAQRSEFKKQKLTVAAERFEIDAQGAHDAKADALMTLDIVRGIAAYADTEAYTALIEQLAT